MSQHKTQITPKKDLKNKNCWGRRFGLNFPDEHSVVACAKEELQVVELGQECTSFKHDVDILTILCIFYVRDLL